MASSYWTSESIRPRIRVICDNDYSGDPDGLVQLAHHVLSPAADVRAVVGSHLRAGDPWDPSPTTADKAVQAARTVLELCHRTDVQLCNGSNDALVDTHTPIATQATTAIIDEAMRDDADLPLFVTCGAGLTEVASAWLLEPRIGARLVLVWIGGNEHADLAKPPPDTSGLEYNLNIDPLAAQVVFNDSDIPIWQVPRNMYRDVLASRSELLVNMRRHGPLGEHLFDSLGQVADRMQGLGHNLGETYVLGDSPLVLLTALTSSFHPDTSSSRFVTRRCSRILDDGTYEPGPDTRQMRIYTALDNRLTLTDLYAKLELHAIASGKSR